MDLEIAKEKIIRHKNKLEQEKIEKEIKRKNEHERLKKEIRKLQPRITKIIEIGNLCIENNINIGKTDKKCKYENDAFETDGIEHQLGFYRNNLRGYPTYKCNHYDYIGYEMGGACGDTNFITDGNTIASTPDYNGFQIRETSKPLNQHMKKFLKDFPKFEKALYKFIKNL